MKKILYTVVSACLLFATSCESLDQDNKSFHTIRQHFAQGAKGAEGSANGLYRVMWNQNYGFNSRLMRLNMSADDMQISPTKAGNVLSYLRDLNPSIQANNDDFAVTWELFYKVIDNANTIIDFGQVKPGLTSETVIADEAKRVKVAKAEAHFMRALSYFYLVRLYGKAPLVLAYGEATEHMPLTGTEELYEKAILPSLEIAVRDLPEKSRSGNSSTPSKWAAKTLRADVYLTMAGWPLQKGSEYYTKAADEAKEIIDEATRIGLFLTPKYEDLWKEDLKKDANEHLFALHHTVAGSNASQYGKSFYPVDFSPNAGWADYYANLDFYNSYPNDDRKTWNYMTEWQVKSGTTSVLTPFANSKDGLPAISKYYNYDNGEAGKSQISNGLTSIYRFADVKLIYAEASNLATGSVSTDALQALNDVQGRSNSILTTNTNSVDFDKAVFAERGWEFFAEFRRWFDLVRREKLSEVKPTEWNNSSFKQNNHYYFPIPSEQIRLTGWENNAGY